MDQQTKIMLERAAMDYRDGRTTFGEYLAATKARWESVAGWLMNRWRGPVWVDKADVLQDLYLGAWTGVWGHDDNHTMKNGRDSHRPLHMHVEYTAIDKAKKRLHKVRGAKLCGNADSAKSRMDVAFSAISDDPMVIDAIIGIVDPEQQREIRTHEICASERERLVMRAVMMSDTVKGSVDYLFEDEESRERLGIEDRSHAGRIVGRTTAVVARRLKIAA